MLATPRGHWDRIHSPGVDPAPANWTMRWTEADGSEGVSRGTDIFTVRDEEISYTRIYE
jgi:hypothetical protein